MLPAYLTLLITGDSQQGGAGAVWRAMRLAGAMTAGFLSVFGIYAAMAAAMAAAIAPYLPWVTVVTGAVLVLLGLWLVSGRQLLIRLPHVRARGTDGSLAAIYTYGVSYAIASLSCTIAPFLAVTARLRRGVRSWGTGGR